MKRSTATCILSNCSSVCAIATAFSLFSPGWADISISGIYNSTYSKNYTVGLFEYCSSVGCKSYSASFPPSADFKVTQILFILSIILLLVNSVYCIIVDLKGVFPKGIFIVFTLSAICCIVALVAITVDLMKENKFNPPSSAIVFEVSFYGYSYFLGWVACCFNLALVPMSFILIKGVIEYESMHPEMIHF